MGHKRSPKKISVTIQAFNLRKLFPNSEIQVKQNMLTWIADITPSPMSDTYKVRLQYKLENKPQIHVLHPKLTQPGGKRLPHTYPGKRLCLYYPPSKEWRGEMLLCDTIIPWISEWLMNYEIWISTGKWCGGGIHPTTR